MSNNRKYTAKIGRNKELITKILPGPDSVPYPQARESDANLFDIMTDYTRHKIGTPQEYSQGIFVEDYYKFGYNDISVIPPKSITIDDAHMEVEITDNKNTTGGSSSQQPCKATFYNLRKDTRDFIRVGDALIIHGGDEDDGDDLPLLYVGQIESIRTLPKTGDEDITEIVAKATTLLKGIKINRSYPPLTTVGEVIQDLVDIAASKGLPTGQFLKSDSYLAVLNREYPFGCRINGQFLDALQEICEGNHYRAYVVLGRLYVHPKLYTEYRKVVTITSDMVKGTVEIEEDSSGSTVNTSGSEKGSGYKVTVKLNGNIDTTTIVRLRTKDVTADCIVPSLKHVLQYEGQAWETQLSLSEVKNVS